MCKLGVLAHAPPGIKKIKDAVPAILGLHIYIYIYICIHICLACALYFRGFFCAVAYIVDKQLISLKIYLENVC